MVASLLLPISGSNINVKVHPVVLLQICDSYIRRGEKQERVIGTLLGTVSEGTVNVSRCFVVPHTETMDQVSCSHKSMLTFILFVSASSRQAAHKASDKPWAASHLVDQPSVTHAQLIAVGARRWLWTSFTTKP
jgi:hypothetical protein